MTRALERESQRGAGRGTGGNPDVVLIIHKDSVGLDGHFVGEVGIDQFTFPELRHLHKR
jgi:hypothetical protein